MNESLTSQEFVRLANNFYNKVNSPTDYSKIALDSELCNYIKEHTEDLKKRYKVAMVFICLNPLYWEYGKQMVDTARTFFLPGHDTDFLFWTDIPENPEEVREKMTKAMKERGVIFDDPQNITNFNNAVEGVVALRGQKDIQIFPIESIEWPMPTLLRYNLFLQQEEKLKEYDYVFYCDVDMKFVNVVGDEILGEGLTSAQHPMYALRKEYWPPYEPNPDSQAYIPRPGKVVIIDGKPRFMPLYYAGGFQGGKTELWIQSMRDMRTMIDKDLSKNYIPIWNDESIWNKYLFENPPSIVLTPSYIYPDSLIEEYYMKLWGCNYTPKLVTITKWFSLSKAGGEHIQEVIKQT